MAGQDRVVGHATRADDGLTRFCSNCGTTVEVSACYCATCGFEQDPDTPALLAAPNDGALRRGRMPLVIGSIVLAVGLASLAAASFVVAMQPPSGRETLADSTEATTELFVTVSAAESTEDLRSVAAQAESTRADLADTLPTLGAEGPTVRMLASVHDLLVGLGEMSTIDGENLGAWASVRSTLDTSLAEMPERAEVDELASAATDGIAAVDVLVADAETEIAAWEASVEAAQAQSLENSRSLTVAGAYEAAVRSHLKTFSDLEAVSKRLISQVVAGTVLPYDDARTTLTTGALARRQLARSLDLVTVPTGLEDEHDRLVALIGRSGESATVAAAQIEDPSSALASADTALSSASASEADAAARLSTSDNATNSASSRLAAANAELRDARRALESVPSSGERREDLVARSDALAAVDGALEDLLTATTAVQAAAADTSAAQGSLDRSASALSGARSGLSRAANCLEVCAVLGTSAWTTYTAEVAAQDGALQPARAAWKRALDELRVELPLEVEVADRPAV